MIKKTLFNLLVVLLLLIISGFAVGSADLVSIKDYGAKGDYVTDDTSAIVAADDFAATHNKPLYFPAGTYRITNGIDKKAPLWVGDGAPVLGTFPQIADDKRFLRPGYKSQMPGSSIFCSGKGTNKAVTPRVDNFSSFTYCVKNTNDTHPTSIKGLGVIMDMDVLDGGGKITSVASDARSAYDVGYYVGSNAAKHADLTVFGYWPKAGIVVYGANTDYIEFMGGSSSGNVGAAIIGDGTNGLSGIQFFGWSFFANDHHSRSIVDNQWGATALYIDGAVKAGVPNGNISGQYFFGGAIRTYANTPIIFDHSNSSIFSGVVFEWPTMAKSDGAQGPKSPAGTSNTFGVVFDNCRHLNPVGKAGIYAFADTIGGTFIHSDPRYGKLAIANQGKGVVLHADNTTDPSVQITTNINSGTSGWIISIDTAHGNRLAVKYNNVPAMYLGTDGTLQTTHK